VHDGYDRFGNLEFERGALDADVDAQFAQKGATQAGADMHFLTINQ
jgi:hypothetical protein